MNAAMKLPLTGTPVIPCTPAEQVWIENNADLLIGGADIKFKRRGWAERKVTHADFLMALQDHLNQRQIDGEDKDDLFAQLVLGCFHGHASSTVAGHLIGTSDPRGKLFEIAEGLLRPLAADGVIAELEDADL